MAKKTKIEIILEAVDRATGPINERLKRTEERMAQFRQKTDRIASAMTGFGVAAVGTGTAILGAFGVAVKSAADMESLMVALNTAFQGNEAAANSAFNVIREFSAKTPYQLNEVMTGFIKLKNMGLDPSMAALESYGNTASSMGKSLNQMIEAVADAATGEFERLKEFGIRAKTQGDQVTFTFRGVETTVAKNAEQIERYLMKIGQTDFAGGMEKQSQTLNGRLSTLRDNLDMTAATIGKIFLPAVSDMVAGITPFLERLSQLAGEYPIVPKIAAGFGLASLALGGFALAAAGILKAVAVFKTVAGAITVVTGAIKVMTAVAMANPIVAIATAIAAAAILIYQNWDMVKKGLLTVFDAIGKAISWLGNAFLTLVATVYVVATKWDAAVDWISSLFVRLAQNVMNAVTAIPDLFQQMFSNIGAKFDTFVDFIFSLPSKMFEAGSNLVKSIGDGIDAAWSGFIKKWEDRIQQVRNFLPFSPAKEGPLKDLHRVKIVETLAETITPEPIRRAMGAAVAPVANAVPAMGGASGGAGVSLTYAPTINIGTGSAPEMASSFAAELQRHKQEILRILQEQMAYKNRVAYA